MTTDRGPAPLTPDARLALIRRSVEDIRKAEWDEGYATEYHPDTRCQSDFDADFLLATLDAERARSGRLEAAAQHVLDTFLAFPASMASVHVGALSALRRVLEADRG
jgi:hypothetical protein